MSSSPGIDFVQLEKAPDDIFLSYIHSYLYSGTTGHDLRELCSLSRTVSHRCNKFKTVIQEWQHAIMEENRKSIAQLFKAIDADDISLFDELIRLGGPALRQYLQAPRYPAEYPALLSTFVHWDFFPKSVAMMDRILDLIPISIFPSDIINHILIDPLLRKTQEEEQRQLHIKLAFRLIAFPGVRSEINKRVEQGDKTITSLDQILALIGRFVIQ